MQLCFILVSVLAILAVSLATSNDIGDRLVRTFTGYTELPITSTAAVQAGFKPVAPGHCDPILGVMYANSGEISKNHPTLLYYTLGGQLSGVGVEMYYGDPSQALIDQQFYTKIGKQEYRMNVAFRAPGLACSGNIDGNHAIGDSITVQPYGANVTVPIALDEATKMGFYPGACFSGMGTHYFYDVVSKGKPTWEAANLMPLIPMYNNGEINAIFFTTTVVQQGLGGANEWEPIPIKDSIMCQNFCNADCTFYDATIWSTSHFYFKDYNLVTCDDCKSGMNCCSQWPYGLPYAVESLPITSVNATETLPVNPTEMK